MARTRRRGRRTARLVSKSNLRPLRVRVARTIGAGHSAFYRAKQSPFSLRIGTGPIVGATKRRLQRGVRSAFLPPPPRARPKAARAKPVRARRSRVQRSHKVRSLPHRNQRAQVLEDGMLIDKDIARAAKRNTWRSTPCHRRPDSRKAAKKRWEYAKTGTAPAHKFPALTRWC